VHTGLETPLVTGKVSLNMLPLHFCSGQEHQVDRILQNCVEMVSPTFVLLFIYPATSEFAMWQNVLSFSQFHRFGSSLCSIGSRSYVSGLPAQIAASINIGMGGVSFSGPDIGMS